jgi:hypothetical protein
MGLRPELQRTARATPNRPSAADLPSLPPFPSGPRSPEVIAEYNRTMQQWYGDLRDALQREFDKIQS